LIIIGLTFIQTLPAQGVKKININQASIKEFSWLEGIGPKLAERIVQYRKENGLFESPKDIMKVKGIGPKTWEKNKNRITLE
jgi:competence protein ComEA